MARTITVKARDGHALEGWRTDPDGAAKGGIVVLQAIYGRTTHLGTVCDDFAKAGYAAIAPALYDRSGKGIVFGYDKAGLDAGMKQRESLVEAGVAADVGGCLDALRPAGRLAVMGFCTGGSWAWIMAATQALDAAVIYYGSDVYELRDRKPRCPTLVHYGDKDPIVPLPQVETIRALHPTLEHHLYPGAGHAFHNPEQASFNAEARRIAWERTIAFLDRHLAPRAAAE
ncbi:MAG: dienelactone hydrolase family protein [Alphaproteobacteria bacterium]|nr:dienelactone hydrolase family protein [Alphaproteobacteria bacterium]